MSKLVLNNITSGYASTAALNANNDAIEAALEDTLSRSGTSPNSMLADLDMNGQSILNVGGIDGVGLADLSNLPAAVASAEASATAAALSAINAQISATDSAASAVEGAGYVSSSAASAATAVAVGSLALSVADVYDFGFVTETITYFNTDFGSI